MSRQVEAANASWSNVLAFWAFSGRCALKRTIRNPRHDGLGTLRPCIPVKNVHNQEATEVTVRLVCGIIDLCAHVNGMSDGVITERQTKVAGHAQKKKSPLCRMKMSEQADVIC